MKKTIVFLSIILFMISCSNRNYVDYRQPFEINRNLSCEVLMENEYNRIWGIDVFLIGKKINDTVVYYQIESPTDYDETEVREIGEDIFPKDSISIANEIKKMCEKGTVYWRNYELKLDSVKALNYKNTIDKKKYKVIPIDYGLPESLYFKDAFNVVNLKEKDTFACSIIKRENEWYFQSSIHIEKK